MKITATLTIGVSVVALAAFAAAGGSAHPIYYPYHKGAKPLDPNTPVAQLGSDKAYVAPGKTVSGTWTDVAGTLPFTRGPWGPMQLTDGTVLIQDYCTSPDQWYKLTPDKKGNYTSGTWSKIATLPSGYSPLFYAQQVLTNGNVLVEGGEYNDCSGDWTNKGAIYDPVANKWTAVTPPTGWNSIGDSESVILPDGTYFLADCCFFGTGQDVQASVSGTTVTWTKPVTTWKCASSSDPCMDEEAFTPLPNGDVLLVDVWDHTSTTDEYWIYDTATGAWSMAGNTADYLSTTSGYELGAAALTPKGPAGGTVIQMSANTSTAVNDVYSVANGTWSSGPVLKVGTSIYDQWDAPGATLPDGNVFVQASPGANSAPSHFWELSVGLTGKVKATQVSDPKEAPNTASFEGNLMVLPTGQVIWDNSQATPNEVALYTPKGKAKVAWLPVVSSVSNTLTVGSTGNAISGTNFNGFDLGGAYGDDAQAATNFPIVRITNTATGDVCFGRSYNFSTMGVWTTGTTNATFDIPATCETGASSLQAIVNGIASKSVAVTLQS